VGNLLCRSSSADSASCSLLCDYGEKSSSYFIHCHHCVEDWAEDPKLHQAVKEELARVEKLLEAKQLAEQ
jgi:hypothetical protein